MSFQHATIEFINQHSVTVHIDVLDEDNDEYFISSLAPQMSLRQYSPPGVRWSVRVVHPAGMTGAAFLNVRDAQGNERFSTELDAVAGDAPAEEWTVEVQYVVTTRSGAQTYLITPLGVTESAVDQVAPPPTERHDMAGVAKSFPQFGMSFGMGPRDRSSDGGRSRQT